MLEMWKSIDGYGGKYEVSSFGRVRSKLTYPNAMKSFFQRNGYECVTLWDQGKKSNVLVHRLVAGAFIENPFNYTDVNHIDEDKKNNRLDNLEWCSHSYNMNYGEVREKISRARTAKPCSEETRKKHSIDTSNRKWIYNGSIEKYVQSSDVGVFIMQGWSLGRKRRMRKSV